VQHTAKLEQKQNLQGKSAKTQKDNRESKTKSKFRARWCSHPSTLASNSNNTDCAENRVPLLVCVRGDVMKEKRRAARGGKKKGKKKKKKKKKKNKEEYRRIKKNKE
jgi:hypothetical protein